MKKCKTNVKLVFECKREKIEAFRFHLLKLIKFSVFTQQSFTYAGSGGNENRFSKISHCRNTCGVRDQVIARKSALTGGFSAPAPLSAECQPCQEGLLHAYCQHDFVILAVLMSITRHTVRVRVSQLLWQNTGSLRRLSNTAHLTLTHTQPCNCPDVFAEENLRAAESMTVTEYIISGNVFGGSGAMRLNIVDGSVFRPATPFGLAQLKGFYRRLCSLMDTWSDGVDSSDLADANVPVRSSDEFSVRFG